MSFLIHGLLNPHLTDMGFISDGNFPIQNLYRKVNCGGHAQISSLACSLRSRYQELTCCMQPDFGLQLGIAQPLFTTDIPLCALHSVFALRDGFLKHSEHLLRRQPHNSLRRFFVMNTVLESNCPLTNTTSRTSHVLLCVCFIYFFDTNSLLSASRN